VIDRDIAAHDELGLEAVRLGQAARRGSSTSAPSSCSSGSSPDGCDVHSCRHLRVAEAAERVVVSTDPAWHHGAVWASGVAPYRLAEAIAAGHHRRVTHIDDELLAAAAAELGTATPAETVNRALAEIAARRRRRAALERRRTAEDDLGDAEIMPGAWRCASCLPLHPSSMRVAQGSSAPPTGTTAAFTTAALGRALGRCHPPGARCDHAAASPWSESQPRLRPNSLQRLARTLSSHAPAPTFRRGVASERAPARGRIRSKAGNSRLGRGVGPGDAAAG